MNSLVFKWWVQFVGLIFAAAMMQYFHIWEALQQADKTYISYAIVGILFVGMICCGAISRSIEIAGNEQYYDWILATKIQMAKKLYTYVGYMCKLAATLGLVGTVTGFLMMMPKFTATVMDPAAIGNIQVVQTMILSTMAGMSTAFVTTLVGLVVAAFLEFQLTMIETNSEWFEK